MKKSKYFCILFLLVIYSTAFSQDKTGIHPLTADSLASGNYKDVLSSFFKLAANDLIGNTKNLSFTSNPFAVASKLNPALLIDTNYCKYIALRRLNFAFSLQLDSVYKFNGFSAGITYALINRRDVTISRTFIASVANADNEFTTLNDNIASYTATIADNSLKAKFITEMDLLFNDTTFTFDKLDPSVKKEFDVFLEKFNAVHISNLIKADPKANFHKYSQKNYDSIYNSFQNKHLLTVGVTDTTYSDKFFFKNLVFNAESVRGILNPNKTANLQWDFKASGMLYTDSARSDRNLKKQVFSFEPGFNLVIKNKATQHSLFEFKLSGEYNHIFNGAYTNEKRDSSTINGTLRIRILNDLWIPLEIKYDPKSGNVFGFLNVRLNFMGLSKKQQSLPQP